MTPTITQTVTLITVKAESRIDSRLLAVNMHKDHANLFELVKAHRTDFEQFGLIRFQTGLIDGRGRPEKFALMNEDQAFLLLTYTRNTERTRQLKVKLVKAFGEARRAAGQHSTEYLPAYHQLHDEIHALAAGSSHERHVHMNVNRLINKTVGIEAGQRATAGVPKQALMIVAHSMAAARNGEFDSFRSVHEAAFKVLHAAKSNPVKAKDGSAAASSYLWTMTEILELAAQKLDLSNLMQDSFFSHEAMLQDTLDDVKAENIAFMVRLKEAEVGEVATTGGAV